MRAFQLTLADQISGKRGFAFDRRSVLIGRASDCDLVLSHPAVSRRHARIFIENDRYFVEDLGSSNGTRVNGAPVQHSHLQSGDALGVGSVVLEFSLATRPIQAAGQLGADFFRPGRAGKALLLALALTLLLHSLFGGPTSRQRAEREPTDLSPTPIMESFGYGEGVTYSHPDLKVFELELNAPGRVLVVLHFQSRDVSPGEVRVAANGAEVGALPADVLNPDLVSHEVIIRPELLKAGERNKISFENTYNPPGKETWRIWNLWVETHLLPELPPEQLEREAWASYRRARQSLARQEVGVPNRYLAWKDFRSAWLALEAIPDPKPEWYGLATDGLSEAQRELDRICSKLLLQIQRYRQVKDWRAAQASLEEVRAYFPGGDHSCPSRAERIRL